MASFAPLSQQAQTAYAELVERLIRDAGDGKPGAIVRKRLSGSTYVYAQHRGPLGATQTYLGPQSEALDERVRAIEAAWAEARAHAAGREELIAALRAGGASTPTAAESKLFAALAEVGLFRAGAVLVGTHAFAVLGNSLGVRWERLSLRTDDIDPAQDPSMSVALSGEVPGGDIGRLVRDPATGISLWPIPAFDHRSASTSFRVHRSELRVDLLTPLRGRAARGPVRLATLGASATPLRFLDYLLEETVPAAVVGGTGVLVNVPAPARFALHKLIVASERQAHQASKTTKDLAQASALLDLLTEERPAELRAAWRALVARGPGWEKRARRSLARLERPAPEGPAGRSSRGA